MVSKAEKQVRTPFACFRHDVIIEGGCCCCCSVASVVSDSVLPHRWQPTRLPRPWDSPGKNTGVGCHFLLQCVKVKSESEVTQSCPTLHNPMDCSLPGSCVHGIFQARVLEWGAIAFSPARRRIRFLPMNRIPIRFLPMNRIPRAEHGRRAQAVTKG